MAKYSLAFYTIQIKNTESKKSIAFGEINGEKIENLLYDYFKKTSNQYINNEKDEKVFRTVNFDINVYNHNGNFYYKSITAFVKTGEYGNEEEIVDLEQQRITKTLTPNEAPVKPFGFAIYFHPKKDTAVLVTQSLSGRGIYSQIKKLLQDFIKETNDSCYLELKNVVPHKLLEKLLNNNEIKKMYIETYQDQNFSIEDELGNSTTLQTSKNVRVYSHPLISNKKFLFDLFRYHRSSKISGLSDNETIANIIIDFGGKNINYNAYYNTRITEDISKEFKDEPLGTLKLYKIMDSSVLEYLYSLKIIQPITNYVPNRDTQESFWVDEEKGELHEKSPVLA